MVGGRRGDRHPDLLRVLDRDRLAGRRVGADDGGGRVSFFAAQDEPARFIRSFGLWSLVAMVVVAIYLFALVPAISNIEVLIVALAPTFLSMAS